MSDKGTNWSVTINNPISADEENINLARQSGWIVEGQLEKGKEGTTHYQLIVKTKGQQRFSALKKAFPRAHIELARNVKALEVYVKKEDTRVGELQTQSEFYPSLQKLWDMFANFVNCREYKNLVDADPDAKLAIFDRFIRTAIDEGYIVETMAVNPQIRSSVKLYGENIVFRSLRRQADRQTDEILVPDIDKNEIEVQSTCTTPSKSEREE